MSDRLYQQSILAAAEAAVGKGRLETADASATVDNPLCGDRVTVDIAMASGERIAQLGHVVRGCLLCEASASLLAQTAAGRSLTELTRLTRAVRAMLKEASSLPAEASAFSIFEPVSAHKSRHDCVLLPLMAFDKAIVALSDTLSD